MEPLAHAHLPPAGPSRRGRLVLVEPWNPACRVEDRIHAAQLYRRYGPAIYRRCQRLLRDREAARDATQEVFLKLLEGLRRLEEGDPVLPWLYRVTTNHCFNLRRAARYRPGGPLEDELELQQAGRNPAPPDRVLVRQVLEQFEEVTRLVAVGILVDGLELEEVAAALGLSRRSVSRKLRLFLERARAFLAP